MQQRTIKQEVGMCLNVNSPVLLLTPRTGLGAGQTAQWRLLRQHVQPCSRSLAGRQRGHRLDVRKTTGATPTTAIRAHQHNLDAQEFILYSNQTTFIINEKYYGHDLCNPISCTLLDQLALHQQHPTSSMELTSTTHCKYAPYYPHAP